VPDVLVPFLGGMTFMPFKREKPIVKEIKGAAAVAETPSAGGAA
jgi:hypothetical protein